MKTYKEYFEKLFDLFISGLLQEEEFNSKCATLLMIMCRENQSCNDVCTTGGW